MSMSGGPAPTSGQVVRIVPVPAHQGLVVCFCGPIEGLTTHYGPKGSTACPGAEKCLPAVHRLRSLWKGYACVRVQVSGKDLWVAAVLEVTEHLEEQLRGRDLVGEVWALARENATKKSGPVSGVYLERRDVVGVFDSFDLRAPLERMYHTRELVLGVPNPLPPKLVLPPVSAPRPASLVPEPPAEPAPASKQQMDALRRMRDRLGKAVPTNGQG